MIHYSGSSTSAGTQPIYGRVLGKSKAAITVISCPHPNIMHASCRKNAWEHKVTRSFSLAKHFIEAESSKDRYPPLADVQLTLKTPCIKSSAVMCLYTSCLAMLQGRCTALCLFHMSSHGVIDAFKLHSCDALSPLPTQNDPTLACRGASRVSASGGPPAGGQLVQRALPFLVHRRLCVGGWQHVLMHPCGPCIPCTAAHGVQQDAGDAFRSFHTCPKLQRPCCTELHLRTGCDLACALRQFLPPFQAM